MAGKENKGVFHPHHISKPLYARGGRAQHADKALRPAPMLTHRRAEPSPGPGWTRFTIVDVFGWPLLGGPEVRRLREKPGGQADAGCAPRDPHSVARDIKRPPPPPPFLQIWEDVTPTGHTFRRHPAPRTPQVKAETHLKSVEAAVGLQSEVLGVLQGVNVAVLDDEVAQVLSLWGGAGGTGKLRVGPRAAAQRPAPTQHPERQDGQPHPISASTKKWEQPFLTFAADKCQLGGGSREPPACSPQ